MDTKYTVYNHRNMLAKKIITITLLHILPLTAFAQIWDRMFCEDYRLDTTETRCLKVKVDVTGFFHDNEYTSGMADGYTLPGALLSPRLTYNPINQLHMELGFSALCFNGANKYPNYAYHDIGTWKGSQYTSGFHILPWIRLQAELNNLSIVIGNIYGGQTHGLNDILWNPETNLSQDPEMGFQLLWKKRHIEMDTWLNWQSYIFKFVKHQEAFTVGSRWKVLFGSPENHLRWYLPVEIVLQHRGGEQDATSMGVQTLCNGSIGTGVIYRPSYQKTLTNIGGELNLLGSYQQAGHLWPFQSGFGYNLQGFTRLWDAMGIKLGYFGAPKRFANLYGNPFFSTVRQKDNTPCDGLHTIYLKVSWDKTWAKHYTIGAYADVYQSWIGKGKQEFNFSFGLCLRVTPDFTIKKF